MKTVRSMYDKILNHDRFLFKSAAGPGCGKNIRNGTIGKVVSGGFFLIGIFRYILDHYKPYPFPVQESGYPPLSVYIYADCGKFFKKTFA